MTMDPDPAPLFDPRELHVVTCISNPARYRSRWQLYRRFERVMERAGVALTVVELAYGDAPHELPRHSRHYPHQWFTHVELRTRSVLWHKENLLNIATQHLPRGWKYLAWVDADVEFQNPDWVQETLAALQHHAVVQPWSHAVDLAPDHALVEPGTTATSFLYAHRHGMRSHNGRYDDLDWHPGYAWAIRRDAFQALGGLLDTAILGAGDRHMAMALVGKAELSLPHGIHPAYARRVLEWQARAEAHVHRDVGFVPGLLCHWWHGRKRQRGYADRWQILVRNGFDPDADLSRDPCQGGLLQWPYLTTPRLRGLRDDVRDYFGSRNEDSVDLQ